MRLSKRFTIITVVFGVLLMGGCSSGGGGGDGAIEGDTQGVTILAVPSGLPVSGQQTVSANGSTLFKIIGLTPGTPYIVSIAGTNTPDLNVYNDGGLTDYLCSSATPTGIGGCSAAPSGTALFLKVNDISGLGDTFTLDVTVASVTVWGLGSMPATGQTVSPGADTLYKVTGLIPGTPYRVSIAGTNAGMIVAYDAPGLVTSMCSSFTFTGSASCTAVPSGTSLFLRVADLSGLGDTFTLGVTVAPVTVWGLGSMPATSQTVSPSGDMLFEITGLTPGTFYSVSIAGTNDKSLDVYNDSGLVNLLCHSSAPTGSGSCTAEPSGTSLFLRLIDVSGSGDTFDLDVTAVLVGVRDFTSMPATGQTLSSGGFRLYEITGLTPGAVFSVSIAGTNDKDFSVFNDSLLSDFLCGSTASAGSGSCSTIPSGTSLFLQVRDFSGLGDTFDLDVTVASVTVRDLGSMPAAGQTVSPGGDMLFEITGLIPGVVYSVSIAGTNGTKLIVYNDPGSVNFPSSFYLICGSPATTGSGNCIVSPFFGTSLFLRVADVSGLGDTFDLGVTVAPVTVRDLGSMPATGQTLSPGGDMLFEISGLTAGTPYSVSITGADTTIFEVYDDLGLVNYLCSSFASTGGASCSATPSGTSLILRVKDINSGLGDTFNLDVIEESP